MATGKLPLGEKIEKIKKRASARDSSATPRNDNRSYIQLSASTLSLFKECPRCFWLQLKVGVHRPKTIFPSLPGGMDGVIKIYFDQFRGTKEGLPPEISGKVEGKLVADQPLLNGWRSRTGGLRYFDKKLNTKLIGLLDDCLVVEEGGPSPAKAGSGRVARYYVPLDYKTRGYAPKEDSSGFYQHQLDIYEWLLHENGYKTKGVGFLVYYHPVEVRRDGVVQFEVTPKRMETSIERARELFENAARLLQGDKAPAHHSQCGFCCWVKDQHEFI